MKKIYIVIPILSIVILYVFNTTSLSNDLLYAIDHNNTHLIDQAIENGGDIDSINSLSYRFTSDYLEIGNSVLNYAVTNNKKSIVRYLLNNKIDSNFIDGNGVPVLAYNAASGNLNICKKLLEKGADISSNVGDKTILSYILSNPNDIEERSLEKTINFLIKQGCKSDKYTYNEAKFLADNYGFYRIALQFIEYEKIEQDDPKLLYYASTQGDLQRIKVLKENGIDIQKKDEYGNNILIIAAKYGNINIVRYAIEQGMDIEDKNFLGRTALTEAVKFNNIGIVKDLLNRKAKMQMSGFGEFSYYESNDLLSYASGNGNINMMKLLKKSGYPFTASSLCNAIMRAFTTENDKSIEYLIREYPNIDILVDDETLLCKAAQMSNKKSIELILDRGANIDKLSSLGTALANAILSNETENAEFLLKKGADPNICTVEKGYDSDLPLHYAIDNNDKYMINLLIKYGADLENIIKDVSWLDESPLKSYILAIHKNK